LQCSPELDAVEAAERHRTRASSGSRSPLSSVY
jgi:hypothetical protein